MNLTYRIVGNGYVIANNGIDWIVQEDYIPYPKDTIEASAQAHIDTIIADSEASIQEAISIADLQAKSVSQQETINELTLMIAELLGEGE